MEENKKKWFVSTGNSLNKSECSERKDDEFLDEYTYKLCSDWDFWIVDPLRPLCHAITPEYAQFSLWYCQGVMVKKSDSGQD